VLEGLDGLIGLTSVKDELRALIAYAQAERARAERGGKQTQLSLHFVFRGNPGTGKTTVARIVAEAFKTLGLLPKGTLTEVDRSGLVANYVGQTGPKVNAVVDGALGGVLFIDEAYSLLGDQFGTEAITTLLKRMDDDRGKFIVITAGYSQEMDEFLDSNPGLRSRFSKMIDFADYDPDELSAIFSTMVAAKGMKLEPAAESRAADLLRDVYVTRDRSFANGRTVRNIFEKTIQNQATRIAPLIGSEAAESSDLDTIIAGDIPV
jgi:SpoVK/Ycf46/Vps4 family AAA+-type ATPase